MSHEAENSMNPSHAQMLLNHTMGQMNQVNPMYNFHFPPAYNAPNSMHMRFVCVSLKMNFLYIF